MTSTPETTTTETTTTAEDATTATTEPETTTATAEATGDEGGSGEAAKYRRRLRDAEGERDRLRAQVETLQTGEIARLAAGAGLVDGEDLLRYGTDRAGLLDAETGAVDPSAVAAATERLVAERAHLARHRRPRPDPSQGSSSRHANAVGEDRGEAWRGLLRGGRV